MTPHLDRAHRLVRDAEAAADAILVPMPSVPVKTCGECQGSGAGAMLGPAGAPVLCPGCGGVGRVPKTEAGRRRLREAELDRELLRLRDIYRGVREALREAVAGAEAGEYPADLEAQTYRQKLASLETRGKAVRAELQSLRGHARS